MWLVSELDTERLRGSHIPPGMWGWGVSVQSWRENVGSLSNATCHGHYNLSQEPAPECRMRFMIPVKGMVTSAIYSQGSGEAVPQSETSCSVRGLVMS